MSSISRLIKEVTIPGVSGDLIRKGAFKKATQELLGLIGVSTADDHNIVIRRDNGGVILGVDDREGTVDDEIRVCCEKILKLASGYIRAPEQQEAPRPLGGRVSPPQDSQPQSSTQTSSPASTGPSSERTSDCSSPVMQEKAVLEELVERQKAKIDELGRALHDQGLDGEANRVLIGNLRNQIAYLENELQTVRDNLKKAQEDNRSISDSAQILDKRQAGEIAILRSQLNEKDKAAEQEKERTLAILQQTRADLDRMKEEMNSLQQAAKASGERNAALEAAKAENTALKTAAAQEKERTLAIVQQARAELDGMQRDLNRYKEDIERLVLERDGARARLKGVQEICNSLQEEVRQIKEREANQESQFQELYEKLVNRTNSELHAKDRENEALKQQLSQTHARASGAELTQEKRKVQELTTALTKSEAEIESLGRELRDTLQKLMTQEASYRELGGKYDSLHADLTTSRATIGKQRDELAAAMQAVFKSQDSEWKALQKLEEAQVANRELSAKLAKLEKDQS